MLLPLPFHRSGQRTYVAAVIVIVVDETQLRNPALVAKMLGDRLDNARREFTELYEKLGSVFQKTED